MIGSLEVVHVHSSRLVLQVRCRSQDLGHDIRGLVVGVNPQHDSILVVDDPAEVVLPAEEVLGLLAGSNVPSHRARGTVVNEVNERPVDSWSDTKLLELVDHRADVLPALGRKAARCDLSFSR